MDAVGRFSQKLETMARMQDEHNLEVHSQWRAQGYEYYRAVWVECAELLDHFGWKWWKKQLPELAQVKLEIVDIWHFGLSDLIRSGVALPEVAATCVRLSQTPPVDFRTAVEDLAAASLQERNFHVEKFCALMAALPMSLDELFEIYVGKNMLNRFRQANGYKAGTYVKIWDGREDNEHLAEIVATLDPAAASFPQDVLAALQASYPQGQASA